MWISKNPVDGGSCPFHAPTYTGLCMGFSLEARLPKIISTRKRCRVAGMPAFVFLGECASEHDMVPSERASKTISEEHLAIVLHVLKITQWVHVDELRIWTPCVWLSLNQAKFHNIKIPGSTTFYGSCRLSLHRLGLVEPSSAFNDLGCFLSAMRGTGDQPRCLSSTRCDLPESGALDKEQTQE